MFKIAAYNLLTFIALWIVVLVLVVAGNDIWNLGLKDVMRKADSRAALPVYADHAYAEKIFRNQKVADFDYVPFVEWRHKPFSSETLNVDGRGYRSNGGSMTAADVNPDRKSLGVFGGSTVWGTGVDDGNTVPALLQTLDAGFDVTNYGERGYSMRQNLEELINLTVNGTAPQVVVFYNGFNEIWLHCNYANTRGLNGHLREQRIREALEISEDSKSSFYRFFIEPVADLIARASGGKKFIPACSTDPERAQAVAAMIVENWEIAHELVTRHGGQFFAFLQPNAHVGNPNVAYLDLSERVLRSDEYRTVYPLVLKLVQQKNLAWVDDLSGVLDGEKQFFIDDVHLAPEGNKIVAQHIYSFLKVNPSSSATSAAGGN